MSRATSNEPSWVIERLRNLGLPVRRNGKPPRERPSGRATARWHTCKAPVLVGVAWPWSITLDPCPVTSEGELFAILAGRACAEMDFDGTLTRRRPENIAAASADVVPVYIEHRCGGPFAVVNSQWAPIRGRVYDAPPF